MVNDARTWRPLSDAELEVARKDIVEWGMTAGPDGGPLSDVHVVLGRLMDTITRMKTQRDAWKLQWETCHAEHVRVLEDLESMRRPFLLRDRREEEAPG